MSETYRTFVMNTRTGAVTEYQNFAFNSYAKINGKYYGASESGLYELSGDDDAGTNIDWVVKTGQIDNQISYLKRMPEIVVGLRQLGSIRFRVHPDDNTYYDYPMPPYKSGNLYQHRVLIGKGLRSRYFAVEMQAINNSKIELDSLNLGFAKTTRRLG
jgi:hypothetical protein